MTQTEQPVTKRWFTPAGANLVVNTLSFLCLIALAGSGMFVLEDLEPGQSLMGIPREGWVETHERAGMLMVLLVGYHLVRHRDWIGSVLRGRLLGDAASRRRTLGTVALAVVVFLILLAAGLHA